jgi:hypothetical protein
MTHIHTYVERLLWHKFCHTTQNSCRTYDTKFESHDTKFESHDTKFESYDTKFVFRVFNLDFLHLPVLEILSRYGGKVFDRRPGVNFMNPFQTNSSSETNL